MALSVLDGTPVSQLPALVQSLSIAPVQVLEADGGGRKPNEAIISVDNKNKVSFFIEPS